MSKELRTIVNNFANPEWVAANSIGNTYNQTGEASRYDRYWLRSHLSGLLVRTSSGVTVENVQLEPTVGQARVTGTVVSTKSTEEGLGDGLFAAIRRRTVHNGTPDVNDPMDLALYGKVGGAEYDHRSPLAVVDMMSDAFYMNSVPGMRMSQEAFGDLVVVVNHLVTTVGAEAFNPSLHR